MSISTTRSFAADSQRMRSVFCGLPAVTQSTIALTHNSIPYVAHAVENLQGQTGIDFLIQVYEPPATRNEMARKREARARFKAKFVITRLRAGGQARATVQMLANYQINFVGTILRQLGRLRHLVIR